ncbi:MAG: rhodanese-like domain-containing protein [Pseudomonadota bacterium]
MIRRRLAIWAGVAFLLAAVAMSAPGRSLFYSAITQDVAAAQQIDALTAHARAAAGEILLIDVRRPDEWAATGSGEGAARLDMRRDDFIAALVRLAEGDRTRSIAIICARGVRSARMTNRLTQAGFTRIIDVPEGMLGSAAGPGWIKRGLPLDRS